MLEQHINLWCRKWDLFCRTICKAEAIIFFLNAYIPQRVISIWLARSSTKWLWLQKVSLLTNV